MRVESQPTDGQAVVLGRPAGGQIVDRFAQIALVFGRNAFGHDAVAIEPVQGSGASEDLAGADLLQSRCADAAAGGGETREQRLNIRFLGWVEPIDGVQQAAIVEAEDRVEIVLEIGVTALGLDRPFLAELLLEVVTQ